MIVNAEEEFEDAEDTLKGTHHRAFKEETVLEFITTAFNVERIAVHEATFRDVSTSDPT